MSAWNRRRVAVSLAIGLAGVGCQTSQSASSSETPAAAPVSEPEHKPHHGEHNMGESAHRGDHFADPERFVAAWNAPERDAWQKPEEILAALQLEPGDTVVDLGAGTGYLTPRLSTAVGASGKVIASDIEPAMLAFLDEAAAKQGWTNVQTLASAPDDPKLPPASVDAIVTLNTWHHIGEREAYAKKLRAALRPGGVFVVVDFRKEDTEGFGPPLAMRVAAEQVQAELTAGGFKAAILEESMPRHYVVRGVVAE